MSVTGLGLQPGANKALGPRGTPKTVALLTLRDMSFPPLAAALFAVSLCLFLFLRRRQCRDITGQTSSYSPVLVEKSFTTPAVPPQPPSTPWDTPPLPYRPFRFDQPSA